MPFAQAVVELAFFWHVTLGVSTVRQRTEAAGAAYVAAQTAAVERLERTPPPAPPGPVLQQVSADGAMVPLVGGVWAEVKTLAIGTVQVDGEQQAHATDLSYFSRLTDHERFARLALVETHRRGVATAGTVVGVTDGSDWPQGFLDYHRPDAVRVLDFPHAVEHLTAAVQATLGIGTAAGAAWLTEQAHALKHAEPLTVLAALAALPVSAADDPAAAAAARDATLGYLTKRWGQIQYARFQALGYPIGDGAVESAHKLVVEARLKGSGMHWAREHVDPMVALRTIACTDRWGEAWPQIVGHLRTRAAVRRCARHQARSPVAAPAAVPPAPAPARPRQTTGIPRLRPIRSSQPHPWRRPLLAGGRARQNTDAKD
jgi:hypothetical protein